MKKTPSSEELWTSYESIVHANFALNNSIKLIHRMIEQGLIDGKVEVGKKHTISLNNIIEQIQAQIKRSNDATKQIKNILNSLKDENNCWITVLYSHDCGSTVCRSFHIGSSGTNYEGNGLARYLHWWANDLDLIHRINSTICKAM